MSTATAAKAPRPRKPVASVGNGMRPPTFHDTRDQTTRTVKIPTDIQILPRSSCGKAWTISNFMLWVTADHLRSGENR